MRASAAAPWRGLSEPTIRAWARRGVLRVRSRKPRLLLDPASVLEIRRLVEDLRRAGQSGSLLDEVFNHLADEQLLAEPSLAESLGQMHPGEYVVRRPRPSYPVAAAVRTTLLHPFHGNNSNINTGILGCWVAHPGSSLVTGQPC